MSRRSRHGYLSILDHPGMTQTEVAALLGVSRTTLRTWDRHGGVADDLDRQRLSDAYTSTRAYRTRHELHRSWEGLPSAYERARARLGQEYARKGLERLREHFGMSWPELGESLGVSRSLPAYWMRETTTIPDDVVEKINRAERATRTHSPSPVQ